MNAKDVVVRIVRSSDQPAIPQSAAIPARDRDPLFEKTSNILTGSSLGLGVGLSIYLLFKIVGVNLGPLETSIIIGLPSLLGTVTSFAVF
jgi:hypothetical protein